MEPGSRYPQSLEKGDREKRTVAAAGVTSFFGEKHDLYGLERVENRKMDKLHQAVTHQGGSEAQPTCTPGPPDRPLRPLVSPGGAKESASHPVRC